MYAVLGLLNSTLYSALVLLGFGTGINKLGKFFKVMEDAEGDNFKKAFDSSMSDISDEFNNSFLAINLITSNSFKLLNLSYSLLMGDKYIKKSKDGRQSSSRIIPSFSSLKNEFIDFGIDSLTGK